MKKKSTVVGMLLILSLSFGTMLNVQATSVDEATKKGEELEAQKKAVQEEKNKLTSQLDTTLTEMEAAQEKLAKKQDEIETAENELVEAKIDENNQYESMKKRIKYMYENGNSQMIEIIFSSESISDFLNKTEYISQISTYDRDMLTEFQNTVKDVEEKENALHEEYASLSLLRDDLLHKQDQIQTLLEQTSLQIADLESEIGENAALLQQLIEQAEAERQKQLEQERAAQLAAEQAAQNANNSNNGFTQTTQKPVISGNGLFTNPCPAGYISSTFGYRDFDKSVHKGLDLAAPEGTPTYAAEAGTVVISGWSNSAGNWVVINHGNGLVTKYMHHSGNIVSAGQTVVKGQQIGYVGNTGNSFGAHLHFQVELNGTAVDPQAYL